MTIEEKIQRAVSAAVRELYGADTAPGQVAVQPTRREFEGNFTVVVFPWVKAARKAPEAVAAEIGRHVADHEADVAAFNVVKGFLNLSIDATRWAHVLRDIAAAGRRWGLREAAPDAPLVMVEYSSPNTNKPLHLGHVRNNLLGWSLSAILAACGNRVVRTNIVNDRGIHICKSMIAWQRWGRGETPESSGKKGDHLIGDYYVAFDRHYRQEVAQLVARGMAEEEAKEKSPLMQDTRRMLRQWEEGDPQVRQLWQTMNQWVYDGFDQTYRRLGVAFDKIYYESQTYLVGKEKVLGGLRQGLFERHDDGSVWADFTAEGLDKKLLLRSDGTSVYMTQDIGTATLRYADYPIDRMIYVVGNEQNYHFQVLSLLLDRLGLHWGKDLVHFSYGMVELPEGKMKSREGTVVDADDLMDEMVRGAREISQDLGKLDGLDEAQKAQISEMVGMGALKYFLLKVDPRKNILFNPQESIDFNGNTGPFIQYTHARIRSVLRKAAEKGLDAPGADYHGVAPGDRETALIQALADFPSVVQEAGRQFSPALIANYAYDVTKLYNQFYHDCPILPEADGAARALRLDLCRATAATLRTAMGLLGIGVPERM